MEYDRLIFIKKRKKVGLAGWWGGKNEGDLYILKTLKRTFNKEFRLSIINIPFQGDPRTIEYLNTLDFLIIGGGGLFTLYFPSPFGTYNEWGESLKTPFGFLGIGVQEIDEKMTGILANILNRSAFFSVRDTDSYNIVRNISDRVEKTYDLAFLYPRKIRARTGGNKIGVNLRIWDFDENRTYDNDRWCRAINNLKYEKVKIPLSFLKDIDDRVAMKDIAARNSRIFNIKLYNQTGIMVGMRLHSLIFAVQNGIPPIGISYAPKVERFFDDMDLKEFCLGINEYGRLYDLIEKAEDNKERIKTALDRYNNNANMAVSEHIDNVIDVIKNI
ncbi:MAG: Polysaccharide pyruvyl transferase [Syntrophorhabdus sp. PtaU1.Bin058]|nr:MAG: Polysaccharide pyruvyl transferase [Syntrophorhabdus sp. PtaU1.Bin058]